VLIVLVASIAALPAAGQSPRGTASGDTGVAADRGAGKAAARNADARKAEVGKGSAKAGAGAGAGSAKAQSAEAEKAKAAASAQLYAQRFAAECAACHGANGRGDMAGVPVLAGQHAFYAITQLFLFREGRRSNEAMTAVAKTLKDDDLRGFSDHIGTLLPVAPPPPATAPDPARMSRGQALAQQHKCLFCHGDDLAGGQQVPRIAGQREEYLKLTLQEFKSGRRPGYSQAMFDPVGPLTPADIDTLAYYVARFPAPK
nr:c-type cytochrome [Burkholderiaceae bacterium]